MADLDIACEVEISTSPQPYEFQIPDYESYEVPDHLLVVEENSENQLSSSATPTTLSDHSTEFYQWMKPYHSLADDSLRPLPPVSTLPYPAALCSSEQITPFRIPPVPRSVQHLPHLQDVKPYSNGGVCMSSQGLQRRNTIDISTSRRRKRKTQPLRREEPRTYINKILTRNSPNVIPKLFPEPPESEWPWVPVRHRVPCFYKVSLNNPV